MIKENLVEIFAKALVKNWEKPAFTDYLDKKTFSYAQTAQEIARLHILFRQLGLKRGDKVSLIGKNGANWCTVYLATVTYGAVIVPILQDFPPKNVHHIVNHSDTKLIFVSDFIFKTLSVDEMPELQAAFNLDFEKLECFYEKENSVSAVLKKLPELFQNAFPNGFSKENVKYEETDNSQVVCISYTSGTTGFSKGVMLTANNLAGNIVYGFETGLVYNARILSFLPLAHAYCCAFDFLAAFSDGSHTYYLGKTPAPAILTKALADVRPNMIFTVPLIIEKIYKKKILPTISKPSVKFLLKVPGVKNLIYKKIYHQLRNAFGGNFKEIIIGGAPLNPDVEDFLQKIGLEYCVGYGMTECAPLISKSPWKEYIPSSVGKILSPQMEVKIERENPIQVVGEILVRGEHVMAGYYKNPEATEAVLDADGWLHTGDMGFVDEQGNIYIRGRNKSMLLGPNGQNIYSEEIESKINNLPLVQESLVLQNRKHKLVALIFPDFDTAKKEKISREQLEKTLNKNIKSVNKLLGSYEQIAEVKIHETEFEKTPKKSIKRFLYTNQVR